MPEANNSVTSTEKNENPTKKQQALIDIELELKALELEEKRLQVETAKANLIDTRERLDERELKRETLRQRSRTNGETLKQLNNIEKAHQSQCNHHKGGDGLQDYTAGRGNDTQYAVYKHKFANGDVVISCMRCHKKWKPPVRSEYKTDESYQAAVVEYQTALNFTTRNISSSSHEYRFSDGGEHYRKAIKNS